MISLEYPNVRLATIIWSVLAGVAAAGALAGLLVWWRRRERPVVLPPPIPPHETAFAELDELAKQREELIAAGAYQDYYLRLTDIAKRYLGGRFGFDASDRTTEEIQDLLRGHVSIDPLDPKAVLTFLLMFVITSVATDARAQGQLAAVAIGGTVGLCALVGGPLTGASMNPARSLGPSMVSGAALDPMIYGVAPVAGAVLAALVYPRLACAPAERAEGCC